MRCDPTNAFATRSDRIPHATLGHRVLIAALTATLTATSVPQGAVCRSARMKRNECASLPVGAAPRAIFVNHRFRVRAPGRLSNLLGESRSSVR